MPKISRNNGVTDRNEPKAVPSSPGISFSPSPVKQPTSDEPTSSAPTRRARTTGSRTKKAGTGSTARSVSTDRAAE